VNEYWANKWGTLGYRSKFECRRKKREGCAMLWKKNIDLLDMERVDLDCVENEFGITSANKANFRKGNVGQIARFKIVDSAQPEFVVANVV
jgi:hypothetical protein